LALLALIVAAGCHKPTPPPSPAQPKATPKSGAIALVDRDYAVAVMDILKNADRDLAIMLYEARFYEEYPDSTTNAYLVALGEAVKRGVQVWVLMDENDYRPGDGNNNNADFSKRLETLGVKVFYDHPSNLSHQKVIVADGRLAIVSSHNWLHYSLNSNYEAAVLLRDAKAAGDLRSYFLDRLAEGRQLDKQPIPASELAKARAIPGAPATGGRLGKWIDDQEWLPLNGVQLATNRDFEPRVNQLLTDATTSIVVAQNTIERLNAVPSYARRDRPKDWPPSLVNELVDDLAAAAHRGVRVRVVLEWADNRDNIKNIESAKFLSNAGVSVFYDTEKTTLHAKMVVVDSRWSVVGSTNWTFNAVEQGNEVSVIVDSPQVAARLTAFVDKVIGEGRPAQPRAEGAIAPLVPMSP